MCNNKVPLFLRLNLRISLSDNGNMRCRSTNLKKTDMSFVITREQNQ